LAELEKRGIPTVVLVSEPFLPMAEAQAVTLEYPSARLVTFEHPLAGIDEDSVRVKADLLVDSVIERFLGTGA